MTATSPIPAPMSDPAGSTPYSKPQSPPVAAPAGFWKAFPNSLTLWILIITITALGAWLRYWRIDHQSLWGDEWSTINRIRSSFDDMLDRLDGQGFPPGWYAALWYYTKWTALWTGSKLHAFSTANLRYLPAIFGTLTVPAMYLLARGFTDRRGALLAMLLAAVNPFLVYYARDLKMYAACYFFATLTMALFLRWQETRRHWLWWPLFSLSACCLVVVHAVGWLLIPIQLIWLLTRPRLKGWDTPLWILTIGLMSLLPLWWYLNRTDWVNKVANGNDGGIGWNTVYTDMNWTTALSLPAVHIFGFLVPSYPPEDRIINWFQFGGAYNDHLATRAYPWLAQAEMWTLLIFSAILLLGVLPWRGIHPPWKTPTLTRYRAWWIAVWFILPMAALASTWISDDSPWFARLWLPLHFTPIPTWEPRYLGIVCPAFILATALLLRRLPTWPLRTIAILAIVAFCTISSLSNQLIYRQVPWQEIFRDVVPHVDKDDPASLQVLVPHTRNAGGGDTATFFLAMGEDPADWDRESLRYQFMRYRENMVPDNPEADARRIRSAGQNSSTQTVVAVDFSGDVKDGPLSDQNLAKILPEYQMTAAHIYRWQVEWRYYIFNEVRVRVWQRKKPAPVATPAATTQKFMEPGAKKS